MKFIFEPPAIVAADFSSHNTDKIHCSSALARHLGLVAGVIMADVWYWTSRSLGKRDGWFYRAQEEWQYKTGLSEDSITRHVKKLEKLGYLETKRGQHPQGDSARHWVKFYRATQAFNLAFAEILAGQEVEDKTAFCGSQTPSDPQNADLKPFRSAFCGSQTPSDPQNADQCPPEPLQDKGFKPPQGSIDQGSIDQGSLFNETGKKTETDRDFQHPTSRMEDWAAGKLPLCKTGRGPNDWDEEAVEIILAWLRKTFGSDKTRGDAIAYISKRNHRDRDEYPALMARLQEGYALKAKQAQQPPLPVVPQSAPEERVPPPPGFIDEMKKILKGKGVA